LNVRLFRPARAPSSKDTTGLGSAASVAVGMA
jgi:hypothetical protein